MAEGTPSHLGSAPRSRVTVAALLMSVVAVGAYAIHERNVVERLAAQNSAVISTLNAARDQIGTLTTRLDAMNAQRSAEKSTALNPLFTESQ